MRYECSPGDIRKHCTQQTHQEVQHAFIKVNNYANNNSEQWIIQWIENAIGCATVAATRQRLALTKIVSTASTYKKSKLRATSETQITCIANSVRLVSTANSSSRIYRHVGQESRLNIDTFTKRLATQNMKQEYNGDSNRKCP